MNLSLNKLAAPLGVVLLAGLLPSFAHAACAGAAPRLQPNSWDQQTGQVRLLPASLAGAPDQDDNVASIVGLWHFKFEVGSTVVDAGFQQWHSDGTELENSAIHAPNTTNFCMGVWEQVGRRQYKLNHFALNWDPTIGPGVVPAGALAGTVHIQGLVTIAPDGQTFTGTFKILFYPAGSTKPDPNSYTAGTYTGTRVNVDTPAAAVL